VSGASIDGYGDGSANHAVFPVDHPELLLAKWPVRVEPVDVPPCSVDAGAGMRPDRWRATGAAARHGATSTVWFGNVAALIRRHDLCHRPDRGPGT
jgi:hypothetical protein